MTRLQRVERHIARLIADGDHMAIAHIRAMLPPQLAADKPTPRKRAVKAATTTEPPAAPAQV